MNWFHLYIFIVISVIYFPNECVDGKECGINAINKFTKIINGMNTTANYPWYVAFAKKIKQEWLVFCGGALVTDRHIVTASHCFGDQRRPGEIVEKRYHVLFGLKNQCGLKGKSERIRKVYLNKRYVPDLTEAVNDIALVALWRSVLYTPICLPTKSSFQHDHGIIIGFGSLTPRSRKINSEMEIRQMGNPASYPCTLQQAQVEIFSRKECMETKYGLSVPQKTICAGLPEGGADACDGDSGGPLMVEINGHLELAGIISYGKGCGRKGYPGIYTDVTDLGFLPWIKEKIEFDIATLTPYKEVLLPYLYSGSPVIIPNGLFSEAYAGQGLSIAVAGTAIQNPFSLWNTFQLYRAPKNLLANKKVKR